MQESDPVQLDSSTNDLTHQSNMYKTDKSHTTETSTNGNSNSITTVKVNAISNQNTNNSEAITTNESVPIDSTSNVLPRIPAIFSPEDIGKKMSSIRDELLKKEEVHCFLEPVTEAIAPGYFDIIKYPMDMSTISKKLNENEYLTPLQFCQDIWLIFNNAWSYNKKMHKVYKDASKVNIKLEFMINI